MVLLLVLFEAVVLFYLLYGIFDALPSFLRKFRLSFLILAAILLLGFLFSMTENMFLTVKLTKTLEILFFAIFVFLLDFHLRDFFGKKGFLGLVILLAGFCFSKNISLAVFALAAVISGFAGAGTEKAGRLRGPAIFFRSIYLSFAQAAPFYSIAVFVESWIISSSSGINEVMYLVDFHTLLLGLFGMSFSILRGSRCVRAYTRYRRIIQGLPTSKIAAAAIGLSELKGRIRLLGNNEEEPKNDYAPFYLEDDTGRILVAPEGIKNTQPLFETVFNRFYNRIYRRDPARPFSAGEPAYLLGSVKMNRTKKFPPEVYGDLIISPGPGQQDKDITAADEIFILGNDTEPNIERNLKRYIRTTVLLMISWFILSFFLIGSISKGAKEGLLAWDFVESFRLKEILPEGILKRIYPPDSAEIFIVNDFRTEVLAKRQGPPPLVYLDFNEGIQNKGTAGFVAEAINGPVRLEEGIDGKSMYFDGKCFLKLIEDNSSSGISLKGDYTLEFWFKIEKTDPWDDVFGRKIFFTDNYPGTLDIAMYSKNETVFWSEKGAQETRKIPVIAVEGLLAQRIPAPGTAREPDERELIKAVEYLNPGTRDEYYWGVRFSEESGLKIHELRWYHILVLYSKEAGIIEVCIDGERVYMPDGSFKFMPPERTGAIGLGQTYSYNSTKDNFRGWIDEFYFYDYCRPPDNH